MYRFNVDTGENYDSVHMAKPLVTLWAVELDTRISRDIGMIMEHSAFTRISTKSTLADTNTDIHIVSKKKTQWPDSLKAFVGRAFETCSDSIRPEVEKQLKDIITAASESGSIWTTDWSSISLPYLDCNMKTEAELVLTPLNAMSSGSAKRKKY